MLLRAHDQRDTPGGDQAWRQPLDWRQMWEGDPGIYGKGAGRVGGDPVMPPQVSPYVMPYSPALPSIARNVVRDLERGVDPVLTGSGFEMSAEDYRRGGGGSVLDMLQQYLREPRPTVPLFESWR